MKVARPVLLSSGRRYPLIHAFAQDAPIKSPGGVPGLFGPERGLSPSAYSFGDGVARRWSAGCRQARSRAKGQRAAQAWCPCPGTRHDVSRVSRGRDGAGLPSPRRRSRLTSTRGIGRANASIEAPGKPTVHLEKGVL